VFGRKIRRFLNVFGLKIRRHCAAAFFLQVPKSCTDLDLNILYISILETYSKFVRKNKMPVLGVCLPQPTPEYWPQICRVKITFESLLNNWFFSTKTNSMKCFENWIPLKTHVRINRTEP